VSQHIQSIITSCAQSLYVLRFFVHMVRVKILCRLYMMLLCSLDSSMPHRLGGDSLYRKTAKSCKLLYIAALWLASVLLITQVLKPCVIWWINECLIKFCAVQIIFTQSPSTRCNRFSELLSNRELIIGWQLPNGSSHLVDNNFIIQMLYCNVY